MSTLRFLLSVGVGLAAGAPPGFAIPAPTTTTVESAPAKSALLTALPTDLAVDGTWEAVAADNAPDKPREPDAVGHWRPFNVPGRWYLQDLDVHGAVWFRRTIEIPSGDFARAFLDIGGADGPRRWTSARPTVRATRSDSAAPFAPV